VGQDHALQQPAVQPLMELERRVAPTVDLSVRLAALEGDASLTAQAAETGLRNWNQAHLAQLNEFITLLLSQGASAPAPEAAPQDYQDLSAAELAQRMSCTTTVVYSRRRRQLPGSTPVFTPYRSIYMTWRAVLR
ncbi:MAG: hypothetical protein ACRECD_07430, partial [Burkholderiaceae bacterium]